MSEIKSTTVKEICSRYDNEKTRMMDIVRAVQEQFGCVSDEAIDLIAQALVCPRVEVESTVSFYAFLSKTPKGKIVIRLCNDIIDRFNGSEVVAEAFSRELGIDFGETTPDGKFALEGVECLGACGLGPCLQLGKHLYEHLTPGKTDELLDSLRKGVVPRADTDRELQAGGETS